jgi:hypothetical protein
MPPLNPPPLNNSPFRDLEIIASQQDARHVRISIHPNPTLHEILRKFLGHLHCPTSFTTDDGALQAKYHTSSRARSIVHTFITCCANTFDPRKWVPKPTLLSQRPQRHTPNTSAWMISIHNITKSLRKELRLLPGNNNAHQPIITPAQQNEPPSNKRPRLSITQQWLHETNGPPAVALNPPTSPTATPATPTYGDDETSWADDGAQSGQTQNPQQDPPFSPHYLSPTGCNTHHL